MMWLVPAAVALLAVVPVLLLVRKLVVEAVAFRREVQLFSDLRPALVELRSETQVFRAELAARAQQLPRR